MASASARIVAMHRCWLPMAADSVQASAVNSTPPASSSTSTGQPIDRVYTDAHLCLNRPVQSSILHSWSTMLVRIRTLQQTQLSLATLGVLSAILCSQTSFCFAGRHSGTTLGTPQSTNGVTATTNLFSHRNLYTRHLLASQLNQNITGNFSGYTEEYEYHANTTLPGYSLQPEDNKCTSLDSTLDAAVASCALKHQFCCIDSNDLQVRQPALLLCRTFRLHRDTPYIRVSALRHKSISKAAALVRTNIWTLGPGCASVSHACRVLHGGAHKLSTHERQLSQHMQSVHDKPSRLTNA